jgi:hypothetical protein
MSAPGAAAQTSTLRPLREGFMVHLLGLAMLLTLLPPQQQQLPDAFYELPEQVREQATLIVTGTYGEGRSPCIFLSDGTRAWFMESTIKIKKIYRGEIKGKLIYLNWSRLRETGVKLTREHTYLVLLRPDARSMKAIRESEYVPFWESLHDEEIIAIVELK